MHKVGKLTCFMQEFDVRKRLTRRVARANATCCVGSCDVLRWKLPRFEAGNATFQKNLYNILCRFLDAGKAVFVKGFSCNREALSL